jgi:hypothetical protein
MQEEDGRSTNALGLAVPVRSGYLAILMLFRRVFSIGAAKSMYACSLPI